MQAGPGPQEVQEGEGEVVDPLQAKSLPAHRHPLLAEGQGKNQAYQTISMGDMPIWPAALFQVQKLKDRQFGRVQLFVPHKNPPATIGN